MRLTEALGRLGPSQSGFACAGAGPSELAAAATRSLSGRHSSAAGRPRPGDGSARHANLSICGTSVGWCALATTCHCAGWRPSDAVVASFIVSMYTYGLVRRFAPCFRVPPQTRRNAFAGVVGVWRSTWWCLGLPLWESPFELSLSSSAMALSVNHDSCMMILPVAWCIHESR